MKYTLTIIILFMDPATLTQDERIYTLSRALPMESCTRLGEKALSLHASRVSGFVVGAYECCPEGVAAPENCKFSILRAGNRKEL
jgi:hypothetical protein